MFQLVLTVLSKIMDYSLKDWPTRRTVSQHVFVYKCLYTNISLYAAMFYVSQQCVCIQKNIMCLFDYSKVFVYSNVFLQQCICMDHSSVFV